MIFDENLVRILEENGQPVDGTLATAPKRRDNPAASPGGPQRAKADLSERGYALGGQDTYGSRRLLKFPANDQGYHNWDSTNHPGNTRFKSGALKTALCFGSSILLPLWMLKRWKICWLIMDCLC